LGSVFRNVRLSDQNEDITAQVSDSNNIMKDFKENSLAYKPEPKKKEETGIYYVEEDKSDDNNPDNKDDKPQKSYFGPPQELNYTLTGIIRDESTGEGLPFANIQVKGTTKGASTNSDGYYTLLKVPTDTSTLIVQYVGYEKTEIFLSPQTPKKNFIIGIKPYSHILKEVKVTAHKDEVVLAKKAEVSIIKLSPLKL
jgi:ferric enterobactin receptor